MIGSRNWKDINLEYKDLDISIDTVTDIATFRITFPFKDGIFRASIRLDKKSLIEVNEWLTAITKDD